MHPRINLSLSRVIVVHASKFYFTCYKLIDTDDDECDRKTFGTQNSYDSHMRSKKHKENVAKEAARPKKTTPSPPPSDDKTPTTTQEDAATTTPVSKPPAYMPMSMTFTEDMTEEEINAKIDEKIKMARRLEETECLFCNHNADTFEDNMQHMTIQHSFFIPDIEYLVDLKGLIKYLGEKLSIGNTCLFCNGKGRELRSLEAVRKHMVRKKALEEYMEAY